MRKFCEIDICHFGDFVKGLRLSLGVTQKDFADAIGIDNATYGRFEQKCKSHDRVLIQISENLNLDVIASLATSKSLKPSELEIITEVFNAYQNRNTTEQMLEQISFDITNIHAPQSNSIESALDQLATCGYPAFLIDPFWFIHAVNGSTLSLFGLDPDAGYMNRWEFWHVLGTKFGKDSPVRSAHFTINDYFPPSVDVFFKSVIPYLFTRPMRLVIKRLHELSTENEYEFSRSWQSATTFNLPYDNDPQSRILILDGTRLNVISEYAPTIEVFLSDQTVIPFMLGFWKPVEENGDTSRILKEIWNNGGNRVYYAHDYDMRNGQNFHVNTWPETEALIEFQQ